MKKFLQVVLAAVALAGLSALAHNASALDKGEEAPNFRFEKSWGALDGASQLTDYRGKVVFIEVWKIH